MERPREDEGRSRGHRYLGLPPSDRPEVRFDVGYRRHQLPFMPKKSLSEHYAYCQDVSQRMGSLLPVWKGSDRAGATRSAAAPRV